MTDREQPPGGAGAPPDAKPGSGLAAAVASTTLDRLIHGRMRLAIVSALTVNATLTFTELKQLLSTTDGNLSLHTRKLEDAGYIASTRGFDGRLPRTTFRLTPAGRVALVRYLDQMDALITAMRAQGGTLRTAVPAPPSTEQA